MANLSKELILQTAFDLVEQKQNIKISLKDVGGALGVSHAALYKYFPNKKTLWTELAMEWLDQQLIAIFPFDTSSYEDVSTIAHDWLWALADGKRQAKQQNPEMFSVYTTYIEQDPAAYHRHARDLGESFMTATGKDEEFTIGILLSFMYFSAPAYAIRWDEHFQQQFELVWALMKKNFE